MENTYFTPSPQCLNPRGRWQRHFPCYWQPLFVDRYLILYSLPDEESFHDKNKTWVHIGKWSAIFENFECVDDLTATSFCWQILWFSFHISHRPSKCLQFQIYFLSVKWSALFFANLGYCHSLTQPVQVGRRPEYFGTTM